MKNTVEFLREHGVVEKLQNTLNTAPVNVVDDIAKDPNMKEFQYFALKNILGDMFKSDEFVDGYFTAIHKDIVDALDLKKKGSGNEFLSMFVDLLKEIE